MVRRLFAHHDRRRVQVAICHARKNGTVGDAQSIDPDNPALRIDNRQRIIPSSDARRTTGMVRAFSVVPDEFIQLRVSL
jgi:hypothetical protein